MRSTIQNCCIFAIQNDGLVAQLNRAFDYGSKGCRFESFKVRHNMTLT